MGSPRESSWINPLPWGLSSIATAVIAFAVFLTFASILLASHPIGSALHWYYDLHFERVETPIYYRNEPQTSEYNYTGLKRLGSNQSTIAVKGHSVENKIDVKPPLNNSGNEYLINITATSSAIPNAFDSGQNNSLEMNNENMYTDLGEAFMDLHHKVYVNYSPEARNNTEGETVLSSPFPSKASEDHTLKSGCDLFQGQWVYDSSGPLYTNNTCPIITQMQNCQGNGRPDKDYENWRWKPSQCELPRFNARRFLELMRGKTLAFVGDSVARNQMESMLCILWQAEVPINKGNKKMHRWLFKSTSTMIVRIWSSWLVHETTSKFDYAPEGISKLHLDVPDPTLIHLISAFHVTVLSSGHWFAKQSVYILKNEIVGAQLWRPPKNTPRFSVNNVDAFGISVETILSAMSANYTGLTILRSYSPDHYEGGAWNTGGSCTGKVRPVEVGGLVENGFTNAMHGKQAEGFAKAAAKRGGSKLKMMDITGPFLYRHDGHPGPYRSLDPKKLTKRGADGRPPPQDCLHWCMPGPVDTWNEMVAELVRREFEETA